MQIHLYYHYNKAYYIYSQHIIYIQYLYYIQTYTPPTASFIQHPPYSNHTACTPYTRTQRLVLVKYIRVVHVQILLRQYVFGHVHRGGQVHGMAQAVTQHRPGYAYTYRYISISYVLEYAYARLKYISIANVLIIAQHTVHTHTYMRTILSIP